MPSMIAVQCRFDEELLKRSKLRVKESGFENWSSYVRYLVREDCAGPSLDQVEDAIVKSISALDRKLGVIHAAQQHTFALAWEIVELLLNQQDEVDVERRLQELRLKLARQKEDRNAIVKSGD